MKRFYLRIGGKLEDPDKIYCCMELRYSGVG